MKAIITFSTVLIILALVITFVPIKYSEDDDYLINTGARDIVELVQGNSTVGWEAVLKPVSFGSGIAPTSCVECVDEDGKVLRGEDGKIIKGCGHCRDEDMDRWQKLWGWVKEKSQAVVGNILDWSSVGVGVITSVAGVLTQNELLIFAGIAFTLGVYFIALWQYIIFAPVIMAAVPLPIKYLILSIVSFTYLFAVIEWLRGKI